MLEIPSSYTSKMILGHRQVEELFMGWSEKKTIPHALLLTGARGIGKASLSYKWIRHLLKLMPEADLTVHPDLLIVQNDEKNNITAEWASKLKNHFQTRAFYGGYKIALIDGAQYLNHHAANALLKVLEEPSAHSSLLILVAPYRYQILKTLVSRCVEIRLKPLETRVLKMLLEEYEIDLKEQELLLLLNYAQGSFGKALEWIRHKGHDLYQTFKGLKTEKDRYVWIEHALEQNNINFLQEFLLWFYAFQAKQTQDLSQAFEGANEVDSMQNLLTYVSKVNLDTKIALKRMS
jgi:DNA polymerase III subunit delta'